MEDQEPRHSHLATRQQIVGILNDFDPKKVSFDIFISKLEHFFKANHIDDADKAAILLTTLSDEVY